MDAGQHDGAALKGVQGARDRFDPSAGTTDTKTGPILGVDDDGGAQGFGCLASACYDAAMFDGICLALAIMAGAVIVLGTFGALVAGDWSSPILWLALWFICVGGYCAWPWFTFYVLRHHGDAPPTADHSRASRHT